MKRRQISAFLGLGKLRNVMGKSKYSLETKSAIKDSRQLIENNLFSQIAVAM